MDGRFEAFYVEEIELYHYSLLSHNDCFSLARVQHAKLRSDIAFLICLIYRVILFERAKKKVG